MQKRGKQQDLWSTKTLKFQFHFCTLLVISILISWEGIFQFIGHLCSLGRTGKTKKMQEKQEVHGYLILKPNDGHFCFVCLIEQTLQGG